MAAIGSAHLGSGAVATANVADSAITEPKLADASVSARALQDDAITQAAISANSIATAALQDAAVTGPKIANSAIGSAHFSTGAVDTASVADSAITEPKLADASVSARTLQDGAVTQAAISANSIATAALQDAAVTGPKLANAAIGSAHLGSGAVATASVADSAITEPKLADASVSSRTLQDGAVTLAALDAATVDTRYATRADGTLTGDVVLGDSEQDTTSVRATLKIESGSPALGKRLTSDAGGHASWQHPNKVVHGFPLAGVSAPAGVMMALQKDGAAKVATRIPRNYFDSAGRLVNGYTSQYASISPTRLAYVYHISPTNKTGIEFYNVDTSTLPGEVVREVTRYPTEVDFIPGSANEIAFGPNRFIFASYNAVGVRVVFFDDLGPGNGVGFTTSETFGSDPFDPQSIAVVDDSTFLLAYHGITTNNPDHQARVVVGRADGTFGVPASLGTEHRTTNPHVAVVNDNTAAVVYLETPSLTGDSVTQLRLVAIGADSSVELGEIASEALIVAPIGIAPLTTDLFVVLLNDDGDRILQLWTNADGALGMIGELNLRASQFGNALSVNSFQTQSSWSSRVSERYS